MRLLMPLIPLFCLMASPLRAAPPDVVTDVPAVHSLVAQVMGDLATPVILLDRGADPHHFQMRPSQAGSLAQADLVFWVGPELTPWLERAIAGVGLSGRSIALIEAEGTQLRAFGEKTAKADMQDHEGQDHEEHDHEEHAEEGHDHAHEHDHAEKEHAHAEEGHDHGEEKHAHAEEEHDHAEQDHAHAGTDPHAWLDPANARAWLGVIAAELSAADPANAATYSANAANARAAIATAEAETGAALASLGDTPLVVFHDAYGYFAEAFGLADMRAIALGDAASPGAGRLAALRAEIAEAGGVCVFPEAQHDPAYVQLVTEGTGARIGAALDPSGSSLEYGPALYEALIRGLGETIARCAAGDGGR